MIHSLLRRVCLSRGKTAPAGGGLTYTGPDGGSLIGWWSATDPLVSGEGNDYPVTALGSPAAELGVYGGRAYHQPTSTANGYKVPMDPRTLSNGGVLTIFTLWRNPTTGGSTSSDRLGTLYGSGASDRPTLHCSTLISPQWAQGGVVNDVGISNTDTLTSPAWAKDNVHVTMARITKAADGLSYSASVGLDGTIDAGPSTRTSTDLVGTFNAFGPGNPGFSNHNTGDQVFDVFVFTGVVDYAAIFTHAAGLVSP